VTAAPPRVPVVPLPRRLDSTGPERADPATQQRRRLRFSATLAGVRLRASVLPAAAVRRRQALQMCSAARLLTALGIRVAVVQPDVPWPRPGTLPLRVRNEAGLLGDLALLTAVPKTTVGWAAVADRVLPSGATLRTAEPDPDDTRMCPVTIAYRTAAGPMAAPPRTLAEVIAVVGLVIEVRLYPVVAGADRAA
jgi:hypothetical protein